MGTLRVCSLAAGRPKSAHQMCLNSCLVLGENTAHQLELWKRPDSGVSLSACGWWWQSCWWRWSYLSIFGPAAAAWAPAAFSGVRKWGSPEAWESPRLPLCQRALRAWGRGEGGERNRPVLECKCVEYRLHFVWGFSVCFSFFFVLFGFPTQSSEVLDGVLSCRAAAVAELQNCCLTIQMWMVILPYELATSLGEGDHLCCCTGGFPEHLWEEEHRHYARAGSQFLGRAGALWMKHVRRLAAGSPDVSKLLLPLQKTIIDIRCMARIWKYVHGIHF